MRRQLFGSNNNVIDDTQGTLSLWLPLFISLTAHQTQEFTGMISFWTHKGGFEIL
jgi:hypothetical protein